MRFLEVVAKDAPARDCYRKHGATALLDDEHHLVFVDEPAHVLPALPYAQLAKLLG